MNWQLEQYNSGSLGNHGFHKTGHISGTNWEREAHEAAQCSRINLQAYINIHFVLVELTIKTTAYCLQINLLQHFL